jgi:hypothetical protein
MLLSFPNDKLKWNNVLCATRITNCMLPELRILGDTGSAQHFSFSVGLLFWFSNLEEVEQNQSYNDDCCDTSNGI